MVRAKLPSKVGCLSPALAAELVQRAGCNPTAPIPAVLLGLQPDLTSRQRRRGRLVSRRAWVCRRVCVRDYVLSIMLAEGSLTGLGDLFNWERATAPLGTRPDTPVW